MHRSRSSGAAIILGLLVLAGCGPDTIGNNPVTSDVSQMSVGNAFVPSGVVSQDYAALTERLNIARALYGKDQTPENLGAVQTASNQLKGFVRENRTELLGPTVPAAGKTTALAAEPECWDSVYGSPLYEYDDDSRNVSLGFPFTFYGNTYTDIWVNSNGNMTFGGPYYDWSNPNIPNGSLVVIAPLFGDFTPYANGVNDVFAKIDGTAPNRRAVFTWNVVPEYSGTPGLNTYQAVLFEGNNNIVFAYNGLTTDGFNWAGDPTMDVGISSGTGLYQNVASGGAIPALDGTNITFTWNGSDYDVHYSCQLCDDVPPTISVTATASIWPPNHEMVLVASGISASDSEDPNPSLSVSVSSNEPENGTGDGDTAPDWQVVDNGDGTFDVYVRAERAGGGSGRIYTITATATDACDNSSTATSEVSVPHSKGKK